jgi:hypothetical protein
MGINKFALNAIRGAAITGENIASLFERMADGTLGVSSSGGLLVLNYMEPNQLPAEGELVPTITLALKPFTLRRPLIPAPVPEPAPEPAPAPTSAHDEDKEIYPEE